LWIGAASAEAPVHVSERSDPEAIAIAQATIETMGGWDGWEEARFLRWNFFGGRHHWWDRYTGRVRIEAYGGEIKRLWLMNVESGKGRYFENGTEVKSEEQLAEALESGRKIWINDSYWLVMPFKILDPGVTLHYGGERPLPDGSIADVLELTFADVGVTPENKYELFVSRSSGLIEQWVFFETVDAEASFARPWLGWKKFGPIMLATGHGNDKDWAIDVPTAMPDAIFEDPSPVAEVTDGA
jgi:hypothetical protein